MGFTILALICLLFSTFAYLRFVHVTIPPELDDQLALYVTGVVLRIFVRWPIRILQYFNLGALIVPLLRLVQIMLTPFNNLLRFFAPVRNEQGTAKKYNTELEVSVYNTEYDGVPVRVYLPPPDSRVRRVSDGSIVHFHAGGWIWGSPVQQWDTNLTLLAQRTAMPVVSVDYRVVPVVRFPGCVDDCERALRHHLLIGAAALNVEPHKTILFGESAGGNLAAVIAHRLKNESLRPKACVLSCPVIQFVNMRLPSYREEIQHEIGLLPTDVMLFFHIEYLGAKDISPSTPGIFDKLRRNEHVGEDVKKHRAYKWLDERRLPARANNEMIAASTDDKPHDSMLSSKLVDFITHPDYSPIFACSCADLPPTAVLTAEYDVLRDEGILYAERLKEEGVDTRWLHYPNAMHTFMGLPGSRLLRHVYDDIAQFISEKAG